MTRIATRDGIPRSYLHVEVADRVRRLILDGDLPPGSRIHEVELADRFGVSRTPMREAIKILATEGLLELLPNRGARVASVSAKELDETLEVIGALEALAGELAATQLGDGEMRSLEAIHAAIVAHWQRGDEQGYLEQNRAFHSALVQASGNATLAGTYAQLSGRVQKARYTAHKTPEQWRRAVAEHEEMMRLLRARDGAMLGALLRRHIRGKREVLAAAFGIGK
jgi:DNA-binding GntR family transcriptional regulator